jgi:NADH-quinone oxidoreductase subunit K
MLDNYLIVGAILFTFGVLGFLTRRNMILMMLSAELMLHGVSLNLVAFSQQHGDYQGQSFTVFVLTVAACEAGIALALILTLFGETKTLDISKWHLLGEAVPPPERMPVAEPQPVEEELPKLTPSGLVPILPEFDTRNGNEKSKYVNQAEPSSQEKITHV